MSLTVRILPAVVRRLLLALPVLLALAGGLAAKLLPHVDTQPFIDAFLAKREHRELVATMPVHALTSEDLGLLGTLAHAASL